jgi:TolA-binding protein
MKKGNMRSSVSIAALAAAGIGVTGAAQAQDASDAQIKALQAKIEQLQRQNQMQINELQRQVKQLSGDQAKANAEAKAAKEQAAAAQAKAQDAKTEVAHAYASAGGPVKAPGGLGWFDPDGHGFFERKPGSGPLTLYVPGGEISAYGNLDVSFDYTSKNVKDNLDGAGPHGDSPLGNFGWMPAISTNLSYFGLRGRTGFLL